LTYLYETARKVGAFRVFLKLCILINLFFRKKRLSMIFFLRRFFFTLSFQSDFIYEWVPNVDPMLER